MVLVCLLLALVTLTLRAAVPIVGGLGSPLGGGPVCSEEGKVAGVDEVLEGGQALDQVALEGVVRQQAQRRQAVDAPGAPLLQREERPEGESKYDTNLSLSK